VGKLSSREACWFEPAGPKQRTRSHYDPKLSAYRRCQPYSLYFTSVTVALIFVPELAVTDAGILTVIIGVAASLILIVIGSFFKTLPSRG
jgi:hypothetical protein